MGFSSREGLHVEALGDGYLVLDPDDERVYQLTGDQAEAFSLAQAGAKSVPDDLTTAMAGLVSLGLVTTTDWSRRKVLGFGGAAAAAAVTMVALPSVAAAASNTHMDYLVVAGGGGGGSGGGGAGEVLERTGTNGIADPLTGNYTVTLGGGGGWSTSNVFGSIIPAGKAGANSTISGPAGFTTLTARGGGAGGGGGLGNAPGGNGGSGGGGGVWGLGSSGSSAGTATAVAPGLGMNGGTGGWAPISSPHPDGSGGGGGGAGQAGYAYNSNHLSPACNGGDGVVSSLASTWSNSQTQKVGQQSGSNWYVGGGGDGSGEQFGGSHGGLGGGGIGGNQTTPSPRPDALVRTGGGGAGQGIGSSGIVVIKFAPAGHVTLANPQPASVFKATMGNVDYVVFTNPNTSTATGGGTPAQSSIADFTTTFTIT